MRVQQAGVLALLQDGGRYGYHHLGLTTGGPVDALAFRWANVLCGNEQHAAAIELSVGGLALQVDTATRIAVCGATVPFTIDGQPAQCWRSYAVNAGTQLRFGYAAQGVRSYIAVAGGFQLTPTFGSVATVVREGLGGLTGQPLRQGDVLPCQTAAAAPCLLLPEAYRPYYSNDITVRVLPTYQYSQFSAAQRQQFIDGHYTVSARSDRMAYCLTASAAINTEHAALLSEGICLGTVQIPPDGMPIVMLADRQTIGGYPKIGTVLSIDLAKLAQLAAGASVRFRYIDYASARLQLLEAQHQFARAQAQLQPVL